MYPSLKDKVVLLTGASSGIGLETALRFAEEGAHLALAARREAEGEAVAKEARSRGVEAVFIKTDVADPGQCRSLVADTIDKFGRIDIACNNAGIEGDIVPMVEYPDESFQRVMDINIGGTWYCMQAEIQQMIAQGDGGSVINIGSVASLVGFPGMTAYSASKHAMVGMTKSAAMEYAEANIRVNLVCPGLIETEMADRFTGGPETETEQYLMSITPQRRRGTPLEIAEMILWLASDQSSYVTGVSYPVDGGLMTI